MKWHPLIFLVVGLLIAADKPAKEPPKKGSALQGTWTITAMQYQGKKVPSDLFKNRKVLISADKIVTMQGDKIVAEATYKLYPARKPSAIDTTIIKGVKKGHKKGYVTRGIYALEGDTLRLCAPDGSPERPKEFTTKADSDNILMVLKREK